MKLFRSTRFLCLALFYSVVAAENLAWSAPQRAPAIPFYSSAGREHAVSFDGIFLTDWISLEAVQSMSEAERVSYEKYQIQPLKKFVFGPAIYRTQAGIQSGGKIRAQWTEARLERGRVAVPFHYDGVWILEKNLAAGGEFRFPLPFNPNELFTRYWLSCTDVDPAHQYRSILWYYWDPSRPGCDHQEGLQYQEVTVRVGSETLNQPKSYPEYTRMLRTEGEVSVLRMTFAFGYAEEPTNARPESDYAQGIQEYRWFLTYARGHLTNFVETPIRAAEYPDGLGDPRIIGYRFEGQTSNVKTIVSVVAAAGIAPMRLFARSFAQDHEGFFGWFGHSQIGEGFDAEAFHWIVESDRARYSILPDYQLVYWGGCNSYAYYTLPFFGLKAAASSGADPKGTLGLDILAHGLPSYFSLNSDQASVLLRALIRWEQKTSYQEIVGELERNASRSGFRLLAAVLGDEDNP